MTTEQAQEADRAGLGDSEGSRMARLQRQCKAVALLADLALEPERTPQLAAAGLMLRTLLGINLEQQRHLIAAELSARQVKAAGEPLYGEQDRL